MIFREESLGTQCRRHSNAPTKRCIRSPEYCMTKVVSKSMLRTRTCSADVVAPLEVGRHLRQTLYTRVFLQDLIARVSHSFSMPSGGARHLHDGCSACRVACRSSPTVRGATGRQSASQDSAQEPSPHPVLSNFILDVCITIAQTSTDLNVSTAHPQGWAWN